MCNSVVTSGHTYGGTSGIKEAEAIHLELCHKAQELASYCEAGGKPLKSFKHVLLLGNILAAMLKRLEQGLGRLFRRFLQCFEHKI